MLHRALAASDRHVQSQQDRCRGIDRHRSRNLRQLNAGEKPLHVFNRIDGDADLADFARGQGMVRVHADLRR